MKLDSFNVDFTQETKNKLFTQRGKKLKTVRTKSS